MASATPQSFRPATRTQESLLAPLERRTLYWLAQHTPAAINSDHLTLIGSLAMLGAGLCFWVASLDRRALLGVIVCLALNWFGDSLDGTLARFRSQQRPRYGFYIDHIVDAIGALCLIGGMTLSGFVSPAIAAAMLISFYLLSIEAYLATYTVANFKLSHFKFSPTEMRIVLAIGCLVLMSKPTVILAGERFKLFDVGGVIASAGMLFIFVLSATRNTIRLYREEPLR